MDSIAIVGSSADSIKNFRLELIETLSKNNKLIVCVPDYDIRLKNILTQYGVTYYTYLLERAAVTPLQDIKTIRSLAKIFRQEKINKVLLYNPKPVALGAIAAKFARVKNIYSMITGLGVNFTFNDRKTKIVRRILSWLYKMAISWSDVVFFQNQYDINVFMRQGIINNQNKICLINGSGVNIELFNNHFSVTPASQTVFICVARLLRSKGVLEYLAAAQAVTKVYPKARFKLIGGFDNKSEAISREQITNAVSGGYIEYLGKLEDVRHALYESDVFVLPSYREGTSKSILEAMACSMPVITCDVPGCNNLVTNEDNGFLVPAQNSIALAQAMLRFIEEPLLVKAMGQRSRSIVEDKYDVRKVNKIILQNMGLECSV